MTFSYNSPLCRRLAWAFPFIGVVATAPAATVDFHQDVLPILQEHCYDCHGAGARLRANLDLTYRESLLSGGDRGPAVSLEAPDQSLLLDMISYKDAEHEMPPSGKLPEEEIATLRAWILGGMTMPEAVAIEREAREENHGPQYKTEVNDETRNWWAYRKLVRPVVPTTPDLTTVYNPIDAFVQARLSEEGLTPAPPADRQTMIRRAYYDLLGLPPTPEAVEAFVNDPDSKAYERLIDKLLASPHYGEKWGRHWLDLVRYAETNGYERDNPKPHIWRYRDYVIDAFNEDKPYNQFVREQIAGDELPEAGAEQLIATGYYRLGIWDDEPADPMQGRYDTFDGIVDTTAQVFLGMTMGCARCHDHKIDPIPQRDYYKFLAFFHNITDMHTTNITRSILEGEVSAEYQSAVRRHQEQIRKTEARIRDLEEVFVERLVAAEPEFAGNVHNSDMTEMRYRFFRDTFDALPDFDTRKHEDEGTLAHNFFDLGPRTRHEALGFVFEATLHVPEAGDYTFYLDSDDGSRLSIDGQVVVNYDGLHDLGEEKLATIPLTAGAHPVRLDYFQKDSKLGLQVAWSGPGFERRLLSNSKTDLDLPKLLDTRAAEFLDEGERKRLDFLRGKLERQRAYTVPGNEEATTVAERGNEAPETFVLLRGNPHVQGDAVQPGFPEVLGYDMPELPTPPEDAPTAQRRRILAEWLTRDDNPLTPRVMANRIWQYHFGRGIARTPNDFGQAGEAPTHPELLDWLAAEFVDSGWRMKRMHRLIMLSYTYQMASDYDEVDYAKDPRNDLLWRFDMRRLTSEELRDSILAANGTLNAKVGGPSVYPSMPEAALATSSQPELVWKSSPPEEHTRRSVYIHLKRSLVMPLLQDFDQADTDSSCPVRFSTTQPSQALNLLNSQFIYDEAEVFADRVMQEAGPAMADRVTRLLELGTARPATEAEIERGLLMLSQMEQEFGLTPEEALQRFALLVLNLNEFIFLD